MTGEPKERASQFRIGSVDQTQRMGKEHREDFDRHSQGGDLPQDHGDQTAECDERGPCLQVLFSPVVVRQIEAIALDPAPDHHKGEAQIEGPVGLEGWIEGVEHARPAGEDRNGRHHQAHHHGQESGPVEARVLEGPIEPHDGGEGQEPGDEEGGPDQGVQDAVEGQALVVVAQADRLEEFVEVEPGPVERLQRPEETSDRQRQQRHQQVVADEALLGSVETARPWLGQHQEAPPSASTISEPAMAA